MLYVEQCEVGGDMVTLEGAEIEGNILETVWTLRSIPGQCGRTNVSNFSDTYPESFDQSEKGTEVPVRVQGGDLGVLARYFDRTSRLMHGL